MTRAEEDADILVMYEELLATPGPDALFHDDLGHAALWYKAQAEWAMENGEHDLPFPDSTLRFLSMQAMFRGAAKRRKQ